MNKLAIHIQDSSDCQVVVGSNLTSSQIEDIKDKNYSKALIVTDEGLYKTIGQKLNDSLSSILPTIVHILPSGEDAKSWDELERLLGTATTNQLDKRSVIIAIGGGSVSDISGFAASIYMRGIDSVILPTTLLSQVDAAIGGKTGINFQGIKNVVGSIYSPTSVWCDVSTLESLPPREFQSGMAEVIKYAVTMDPKLVETLEASVIPTVVEGSTSTANIELQQIIFRCIQLKAKIVEKDHRETTGLRHILNFGHTLGHAIESVAGLGKYTHGEAIAIGMVFAAKLSEAQDLCTNQDVKRLMDLLHTYHLPTTIKLPHDELIRAIKHDKKTMHGQTKWVLIQGIGKTVTDQEVPEDVVRRVLKTL